MEDNRRKRPGLYAVGTDVNEPAAPAPLKFGEETMFSKRPRRPAICTPSCPPFGAHSGAMLVLGGAGGGSRPVELALPVRKENTEAAREKVCDILLSKPPGDRCRPSRASPEFSRDGAATLGSKDPSSCRKRGLRRAADPVERVDDCCADVGRLKEKDSKMVRPPSQSTDDSRSIFHGMPTVFFSLA